MSYMKVWKTASLCVKCLFVKFKSKKVALVVRYALLYVTKVFWSDNKRVVDSAPNNCRLMVLGNLNGKASVDVCQKLVLRMSLVWKV